MSVFKPKYSGKNKTKDLRKWYVQFKDHRGVWRRVPGYTDKKLSNELDRKLQKLVSFPSMNQPLDSDLVAWLENLPTEQKARLVRFDLLQSVAAESAKPLTGHIADFGQYLQNAKDNSDRYVTETVKRIKTIVTGCRFTFIGDVSLGKVSDFLAAKRKTGMGKTTSNHYLTAIEGFSNWLVIEGRPASSPLAHLKRINAQADIRRERRSLPFEEFMMLFRVTKTLKPRVNISGPDRVMLYLTAAYTGLRASELASLTPASFDFDSDTPTVYG